MIFRYENGFSFSNNLAFAEDERRGDGNWYVHALSTRNFSNQSWSFLLIKNSQKVEVEANRSFKVLTMESTVIETKETSQGNLPSTDITETFNESVATFLIRVELFILLLSAIWKALVDW